MGWKVFIVLGAGAGGAFAIAFGGLANNGNVVQAGILTVICTVGYIAWDIQKDK